MLDDDSYALLDNIDSHLKAFNASEALYFGQANHFTGCDGVKTPGDGPSFAQGGSGIILSQGAMRKMLPILDSCIVKYDSCWAGDVRVALCLRDAGVMMDQRMVGFHGSPPDYNFQFSMDSAELPSVFHKMSPLQMQLMFELESSTKQQYASVTMLHVYQKFYSFITTPPKPVNPTEIQKPDLGRYPDLAIVLLTDPSSAVLRVPIQLTTFLKGVNLTVVALDESYVGDVKVEGLGKRLEALATVESNRDAHVQIQIPSLQFLHERDPDAPFYLLLPDNAYAFLDNLASLLDNLDPNIPQYIGGSVAVPEYFDSDGTPRPAAASAIVISNAAVWRIAPSLKKCMAEYMTVELCLQSVGVPLNQDMHPGSYRDLSSVESERHTRDPCQLAFVIHNATPTQIQELHQLETERIRGYQAVVSISDIYQGGGRALDTDVKCVREGDAGRKS
ncbi:hypothetical protein HDU98_004312 [Podochytrium sp. JEL0797]|nr:hypothetical protein HDU98_004312 [Podochytrium sp. JEL0797]